jgi:hypothetical protein
MLISESDSESRIIKKDIEKEAMKIEAYLGINIIDNSREFENRDAELRIEAAELVEEDENFVKFVGYDKSVEAKCNWVGSDYLERRAEL